MQKPPSYLELLLDADGPEADPLEGLEPPRAIRTAVRQRVSIPTAATKIGEPERVTPHYFYAFEREVDAEGDVLWFPIYTCVQTGARRRYGGGLINCPTNEGD